MLNQFADYMVLELILGEKIVSYLEAEYHALLYVVVLAYFANAVVRYKQKKALIASNTALATSNQVIST